MILGFIKRIRTSPVDFLLIFLEERKLAPYFSRVANTLSNKVILDSPLPQSNHFAKKIFTVFDIPGYLSLEIDKKNAGIQFTKVNMYKGYMINLKNYTGLDDYLRKRFDSKRRSQFRGYKKRLNISFSTSYKVYFGDISKEHYDYLFDEFLKMLKRRSFQKKILNEEIQHWEIYRKLTFPMILKRQAYLSVLYEEDRPISVCLNMVYDKIVYGCIKTHDIDYAKFSLGFVDLLHQLEWCFDNGFEVFDLLKGNYDYKARWVDSDYHFNKYVIFDSSSRLISNVARLKVFKYQIIYGVANFLRRYNVHLAFQKLNASLHYWRRPQAKTAQKISLDIDDDVEMPHTSKLKLITAEEHQFRQLKKPVIDFLHRYKERKQSVNLFMSLEKENVFFLQGTKQNQKITLL